MRQTLITPQQGEQAQIEKLVRLLRRGVPSLVGASGETTQMPVTVYDVLRQVAELMARGQAITVAAENQVVTTQRAADILGMSRPFFIRLLEAGTIAHHRVGTQRRVYLREVLEYARKRDEERLAALDRLAKDAFEAGLYERNSMPEHGEDG